MRPILNLCLIAAFSVCCVAAGRTPPARLSDLPDVAQHRILEALRQDMPWLQLAELTASNGIYTDDFAYSVAISGRTVVVGAPFANQAQGAAYIFVKPKNGWANMTQKAKLTASDGGANLGFSVAISDDTVLVGTCCNLGGGYIFVRPRKGWKNATETAKLPAVQCVGVAVRGDTAACGVVQGTAVGTVYVFVRPKNGWKSISTFDAALVASDGDQTLGISVATTGDTVVAGAPDTDGENQVRGAAYVFVKPKGGWGTSNIQRIQTETAKLTASDSGPGYELGLSVSVSGDTAVAGAPFAQGDDGNQGAAYVFVKPTTGWTNMTETAKLTANTTDSISALGFSVALCSNTLVAGNPTGTVADDAEGEAYVFVKPASGWTTTSTFDARLVASDGQKYDYFGNAVSLSGTTIVVGNNRSFIHLPGAAYIFGH
jgi:hypothetical protein